MTGPPPGVAPCTAILRAIFPSTPKGTPRRVLHPLPPPDAHPRCHRRRRARRAHRRQICCMPQASTAWCWKRRAGSSSSSGRAPGSSRSGRWTRWSGTGWPTDCSNGRPGQGEFEFRFDGERHTVPVRRAGGPPSLRLSAAVVGDRPGARRTWTTRAATTASAYAKCELHDIDSDRPAVSYTHPDTGDRHRIECDFIAGCDGARGVSREAYPPTGRSSPAMTTASPGWPSSRRRRRPPTVWSSASIRADSPAQMARSPQVTRYYLQVPPGEDPENWPHERMWAELHTRLGAAGAPPLTEGR